MRLLLHSCCAPCTTYCLEKLRSDGHEVHGYFYNPNIHRILNSGGGSTLTGSTAHWLDWMPMLTRNMDSGSILRRSAGTLRADALRAIGCGSFPQRNLRSKEVLMRSPRPSPSAHIRTMSSWRDWAKMCRRKWACLSSYYDFTPGYRRSVEISRELGLYRQPYCGCIFSEEERYSPKFRKSKKRDSNAASNRS